MSKRTFYVVQEKFEGVWYLTSRNRYNDTEFSTKKWAKSFIKLRLPNAETRILKITEKVVKD